MSNIGQIVQVLNNLIKAGYTTTGKSAYKIENGVLYYIPINGRVLEPVISNMDFYEDEWEGIYAYEVRVSEDREKNLWKIEYDADCDGQTVYTKFAGRVPYTLELVYASWQLEYETFGTGENVYNQVSDFRKVFKKLGGK